MIILEADACGFYCIIQRGDSNVSPALTVLNGLETLLSITEYHQTAPQPPK